MLMKRGIYTKYYQGVFVWENVNVQTSPVREAVTREGAAVRQPFKDIASSALTNTGHKLLKRYSFQRQPKNPSCTHQA